MRELVILCCLALLGLTGCATEMSPGCCPDSGSSDVDADASVRSNCPEPGSPPQPAPMGGSLAHVTPSCEAEVECDFTTYPDSPTMELSVRLTDESGEPVCRARVAFRVVDNTSDMELLTDSTLTDADGIATVRLTSGVARVEAQDEDAVLAPVVFVVTLSM